MRIFSHSPGAASARVVGQLVGAVQELFLVAPDEEDFEQFEFQIPTRRITLDGARSAAWSYRP